MFQVSREIDFCYGHRLLKHDGKCKHLHGHNGRAVITLEAANLDERGMVVDFLEIKRVVSDWIENNLDHRMILQRDDPFVPVLREMNEPVFLTDAHPTAETIARLIHEFAVEHGFPVAQTQLWETPHCWATYRPS